MNIDTIIFTHGIKNEPNYLFSGNELFVLEHFNNKRTQKQKKLSLQLNGLTRGYFINRKFRSLTWIDSHKYPTTKIIIITEPLPF